MNYFLSSFFEVYKRVIMELAIAMVSSIFWSRYEKNTIKTSRHSSETVTVPAQAADPMNKGRDDQMAQIS